MLTWSLVHCVGWLADVMDAGRLQQLSLRSLGAIQEIMEAH